MRFHGAEATLADLRPGQRYRFHLYQDEKGAFTRASFISDDFSHLAANGVTFRVEQLRIESGRVRVAWQMPEVKNYNGDMEKPPDIGRSELRVTPETRVWRGGRQVKPGDLAVGDALLVNVSGELPGRPARCMEIWIGAAAKKQTQ